jgi:hypothetical protein
VNIELAYGERALVRRRRIEHRTVNSERRTANKMVMRTGRKKQE